MAIHIKKYYLYLLVVPFVFIGMYHGSNYLFINSDTAIGMNPVKELLSNIQMSGFITHDTQLNLMPFLGSGILKIILHYTLGGVTSVPAIMAGLIFLLFSLYDIASNFGPNLKKSTKLLFCLSFVLCEMIKSMLIVNTSLIISFAFLISSISLYLKNQKQFVLPRTMLVALFTSLMQIDFHNLVIFIGFVFLYTAADSINRYKQNLLKEVKLKNAVATIFCILIVNLYWIVPNIVSSINGVNYINSYNTISAETIDVLRYSSSTHLPLTLIGGWDRNTISSYGYFKYFAPIELAFITAGFLCSLAVYFRSFGADENDITIENFKLIFPLLFVLTTGLNDLTGIFSLFWNYMPGSKLFRDPFKFYRIEYYILFCFLIYSFNQGIVRIKNSTINVVLVLYVSLRATMFFFAWDFYRPSLIPKEYKDLALKYSDNDRFLNIPSINWMYKYNWQSSSYDTQNILKYSLPGKVMFNDVSYSLTRDISKKVHDAANLLITDLSEVEDFLKYINAKYIIVNADIRSEYYKKYFRRDGFLPIEFYMQALNNSTRFKLVQSNNYFSVYEFKNYEKHILSPKSESWSFILNKKDMYTAGHLKFIKIMETITFFIYVIFLLFACKFYINHAKKS